MTIGEIIIKYKKEHNNLSQREFSRQCGLTNGTISMYESGINPKTKKPITPQLPTLNKLAKGMGISIDTLFEMADDLPISLLHNSNETPLTTNESQLLTNYRSLNDLGKQEALKRVDELTKLEQYNSTDDSDGDIFIRIVARKGNSLNNKLKKKPNVNLSDLPDYKGGRK